MIRTSRAKYYVTVFSQYPTETSDYIVTMAINATFPPNYIPLFFLCSFVLYTNCLAIDLFNYYKL